MTKKKPAATGKKKSGASASRSAPATQAPTKAVEESQPACIVETRAEAAAELKRRLNKGSVRSLADWLKQGCPGKPGAYDVDAIEHWVRENVGDGSPLEDACEVVGERAYWNVIKIREQALKAEAERLQLEGRLVEAAEITRLVERLAATLLATLGQWPDWVLSLLPDAIKGTARKAIREKVAAKVEDLGNTVADLLDEWAGETGGTDAGDVEG